MSGTLPPPIITSMRRFLVVLAALVAALAVGTDAWASESVARRQTRWQPENVVLKVNGNGMALISWSEGGRRIRLLVWGAVNARAPTRTRRQVEFRRDYSGGVGTFGRPVWKTFTDRSSPYDGPDLPWFVKARRAPDGSYWALQTFRRRLPGMGRRATTAIQRAWELHVSHWSGPLPELEMWLDWSYGGRYQHLFGRFRYRGVGVYGFENTSTGVPLDTYGRNVYVDTLASDYGAGWHREVGFLTHRPAGNFCYTFWRRDRPGGGTWDGTGSYYRATVMGPGVTPVATWGPTPSLGAFDSGDPADVAHEQAMNDLGDQIASQDHRCHVH